MTIQARITALAQSVGADIKALLSGKQDALVSGSSIKTVNGESLLGAGNIELATATQVGDIAAALDAINGVSV